MNLLILGGTRFLGRHIVEAALHAGHEPLLFNRGRQAPGLFPGVRELRGDRDGDISALSGLAVDAVIDTSGYRPAQMQLYRALADVGHCVFVSTISVYRGFPPGQAYDETAPVWDSGEHYGALKARCEETLEALLPGRVAHVRPGLIVGPHDPTGRFTYWPWRVAQGGEVLAPGRPERPVQWIDARDLASWCVQLAESRRAGVFNAVGPAVPTGMADMLEACRRAAGSQAVFRWQPDDVLLKAGVTPWTGLPLWIPESDPDSGGMLLARNERALAAGLLLRPIEQTAADTFRWAAEAGEAARALGSALSPSAEQDILASA